ncbi:RING finger protein 37 [Haematobia irritans]|uniref:RING finger protein 37 n=1 Tax=Haematobia irritans TaxID=7368 RepID=UPI003F5039F6
MSLINFLNPKLKPSVESDVVCEDGYGVYNLISDDAEQLQRGFMAFSVTKPPIEIVFDFPKAIELKVIKLWNSHGALRSTAFEVHAKYEGIWERVANVRDLAKDVDSLTFCYQSDYSSSSSKSTGQPCETVFFFKTAHKMLSNTKSIKLTIRATHKCPPVLRKVQIWGLPARSLDKGDRELIKSIWNEITNPYDHGARQRDEDAGQRSPSRCIPELNKSSKLNIPEEFLDAITWELMIFPTVLPSGKVVDQSTIDKHSEEESKWGRLPSDPFTGLEFTIHRKAILNLPLKARIEKFLMENSEHFKTVPRSLGSSRVRRSKNRHASQFASLSHSHTLGAYSSLSKSYRRTYATATLASRDTSTDFIDDTSVSPYHLPSANKRARLTETSTTGSGYSTLASIHKPRLTKKYTTSTTSTSLSSMMLTSTATQTTATATSSFTCSTLMLNADNASATSTVAATPATTHNSSIDQAIQQALQKITRFSQIPLEQPPKPEGCINCQSADFSYEIQTCHHLVCRECLVTLTQQEKCICNQSFRSSDVERYHKL